MRLFIVLLLALVAGKVHAEFPDYCVSYPLPTDSFFYSTALASNAAPANPSVGGLMATNGIPANYTNQAVWLPLLSLSGPYDSFYIQFTGSGKSGAILTNYLFLYAVPDGVNQNTNAPIWQSGPIGTGASNNIFSTNISSAILGKCGYFQLGIGNQGTNITTNLDAQVFLRAVKTVLTPP